MDTVLQLLGLTGFVIVVILLAAAVTALVVKLSPTRDKKPPRDQQAAEG